MATDVTATSAASAASAQTLGASSKLAGDFDMFLQLLTTQMQNQDPLSPMDTAQYTQQLVQYSQVEQSIQQNATLDQILSRLSVDSLAQASGFLGRQAVIDGGETSGGAGVTSQWQWDLSRSASTITASVLDASGRVVSSQQIDPGQRGGTFTWDGRSDNGTDMPAGLYTLQINAFDADGTAVGGDVHSLGLVDGVSQTNGELMLTIGGQQLSADRLLSVATAR